MKVKKFNKKLTVNKETVADLNTDAMSGIKGGIYTFQDTCEGYCDTKLTCGWYTLCC
jgi:hypothetical protein